MSCKGIHYDGITAQKKIEKLQGVKNIKKNRQSQSLAPTQLKKTIYMEKFDMEGVFEDKNNFSIFDVKNK